MNYTEQLQQLEPRFRDESDLQQHCVQWWRNLTDNRIAGLLYAIPNGGKRPNAVMGAKLKREGVVAGVPDLHLELPSHDNKYSSLYIEMKTPKGRLQQSQEEWIGAARKHTTAKCEVVRGYNQFKCVVLSYLGCKDEQALYDKFGK